MEYSKESDDVRSIEAMAARSHLWRTIEMGPYRGLSTSAPVRAVSAAVLNRLSFLMSRGSLHGSIQHAIEAHMRDDTSTTATTAGGVACTTADTGGAGASAVTGKVGGGAILVSRGALPRIDNADSDEPLADDHAHTDRSSSAAAQRLWRSKASPFGSSSGDDDAAVMNQADIISTAQVLGESRHDGRLTWSSPSPISSSRARERCSRSGSINDLAVRAGGEKKGATISSTASSTSSAISTFSSSSSSFVKPMLKKPTTSGSSVIGTSIKAALLGRTKRESIGPRPFELPSPNSAKVFDDLANSTSSRCTGAASAGAAFIPTAATAERTEGVIEPKEISKENGSTKVQRATEAAERAAKQERRVAQATRAVVAAANEAVLLEQAVGQERKILESDGVRRQIFLGGKCTGSVVGFDIDR
jgi:hypothetical protein